MRFWGGALLFPPRGQLYEKTWLPNQLDTYLRQGQELYGRQPGAGCHRIDQPLYDERQREIRTLREYHTVIVLDDLSRIGANRNIAWLRENHGEQWTLVEADVRDFTEVQHATDGVHAIFHLASQVAVTLSVEDPRHDFEVNALGTINVLEAARSSARKPVVIYASTNKVYGQMEDLNIIQNNGRYKYQDLPEGVDETRNLDFHSPYGCSKGAADQYCRDYHRIYGLKTVVLRQSCIYGYRQFGIEDQGWVAWFC